MFLEMFFWFLVDHWAFVLLAVVYVVLGHSTVCRFQREVVWESAWFKAVRRVLFGTDVRYVPFVSRLVLTLLMVGMLLLSYPFAPLLWFFLQYFEVEKLKRGFAVREAERERQWREVEAKAEENRRFAQARAEFFEEHPPVLYYNVFHGLKAVMRPADYEEAILRTIRARVNEAWPHAHTLLPVRDTFTFATLPAQARLRERMKSEYLERYKLAGLAAELQDIVQTRKVHLVRKDDIFVPFGTEDILSFEQQMNMFRNRTEGDFRGLSYELVDRQAPAELQHVR